MFGQLVGLMTLVEKQLHTKGKPVSLATVLRYAPSELAPSVKSGTDAEPELPEHSELLFLARIRIFLSPQMECSRLLTKVRYIGLRLDSIC
jgi:hypothetical protein